MHIPVIKTTEIDNRFKKRSCWIDGDLYEYYIFEDTRTTYYKLISVFKIHGNTQEERI